MPSKLVALAALLALAACTTPVAAGTGSAPRPAATLAAVQDTGAGTPTARRTGKVNPDVVCYFERPTGSNIPEKVCRAKTGAERDRARAQDEMRMMPNLNLRPTQ